MSANASRDPGASIPDQDWPTGRLLSLAARLVEHAWAGRLAEGDLSHAGLMALHELIAEPLAQQQVAERCGVTPQTMSRTLDRLERSGYVQRTRSRGDRRRQMVQLTEDGHRAYTDALELAHAEDELLGPAVDRTALRANLHAIMAHLGERVDCPQARRTDG